MLTTLPARHAECIQLLLSRARDLRTINGSQCHENGLIIGEEQVDSKSNEITAIALLLDSLNIKITLSL